jgi:hypothetical protein
VACWTVNFQLSHARGLRLSKRAISDPQSRPPQDISEHPKRVRFTRPSQRIRLVLQPVDFFFGGTGVRGLFLVPHQRDIGTQGSRSATANYIHIWEACTQVWWALGLEEEALCGAGWVLWGRRPLIHRGLNFEPSRGPLSNGKRPCLWPMEYC